MAYFGHKPLRIGQVTVFFLMIFSCGLFVHIPHKHPSNPVKSSEENWRSSPSHTGEIILSSPLISGGKFGPVKEKCWSSLTISFNQKIIFDFSPVWVWAVWVLPPHPLKILIRWHFYKNSGVHCWKIPENKVQNKGNRWNIRGYTWYYLMVVALCLVITFISTIFLNTPARPSSHFGPRFSRV